MNAYRFLVAVFVVIFVLVLGRATDAARRTEKNPMAYSLGVR